MSNTVVLVRRGRFDAFLYAVERETDARAYGKLIEGAYHSPAYVPREAILKRGATPKDLAVIKSAIGERDRRMREAAKYLANVEAKMRAEGEK